MPEGNYNKGRNYSLLAQFQHSQHIACSKYSRKKKLALYKQISVTKVLRDYERVIFTN